MRVTIIILAAALALAACGRRHDVGSGGGTTVVIPGANGASVTLGTSLPAGLPDFVKVYPGATITNTTTMPGGGMIVAQTGASQDQVAAFYKQTAAGSGFTTQMDSVNSAGANGSNHVLLFTRETPSKATVNATITTEGGMTKVALLYGQGA